MASCWTGGSCPGCSSETGSNPTSVTTFKERLQSTFNKHRTAIIVSHVILIILVFILIVCLLYYQGTSNHQKDAIKFLSVTCPADWIGHQGHCYKLSGEEKNWKKSQNICILHNASLAKITEEEMDFVTMLTRNHVFWIGLKREPHQPWKWLDGEHSTLEVMGNGGDCAFLNDDATASSGRCSTEHRYICKKNDPESPQISLAFYRH